MDQANGNESSASVTSIDVTPASGKRGAGESLAPGAVYRPGIVRQHVHGSVLEGGDSPAVLAQPAATMAQGLGSRFDLDRQAAEAARAAQAARAARRAIAEARNSVSARYRRVSDNTDDFVHDNPWKAITLAAIGGLIVGLLATR